MVWRPRGGHAAGDYVRLPRPSAGLNGPWPAGTTFYMDAGGLFMAELIMSLLDDSSVERFTFLSL